MAIGKQIQTIQVVTQQQRLVALELTQVLTEDGLEESGRTISRLESRESEVIIDLDNEIDGLRDEVSDLESENIDLRKKIKSIHEMTEL